MKATSAQKLGPRGNTGRTSVVHRTATHSGASRATATPTSSVTRIQTSIRPEAHATAYTRRPSDPHFLTNKIVAPSDQRTSRSSINHPASGRNTQRGPAVPPVGLSKYYEQTTSAKVSGPSNLRESLLASKSRQSRGLQGTNPMALEKQRQEAVARRENGRASFLTTDPSKHRREVAVTPVMRPERSVLPKATDYPFMTSAAHPPRFFAEAPTPSFRAPTPSRRPSVLPAVVSGRTPAAGSHTPLAAGGHTPHPGTLTPHAGGHTPQTTLAGALTPGARTPAATPSAAHARAYPPATPTTHVYHTTTSTAAAPRISHNTATTTYTPMASRFREGGQTPTYGQIPDARPVNHHRGQTPVHTPVDASFRRPVLTSGGSSTTNINQNPASALAAATRATLSLKPAGTATATTSTTTPTSTYRASNSTSQTLTGTFSRATASHSRQSYQYATHKDKRLPFLENKHMSRDGGRTMAPTPLADSTNRALFPKSYTPTNATTAASTPSQHTPPIYSPIPTHSLRRHDEALVYEDHIIKLLDGKPLNHTKILKDAQSQLRSVCFSPRRGRCYKLVRVLQSAIYGGVFEAEVFERTRLRGSSGKPSPVGRAAVKIMLRAVEIQHKDSLQEDIEAEVNFQQEMKGHPNVLSYDELWEDKDRQICFVIMPFAEFEDLFEVLRKRGTPFSEDEARWLFRQLLSGVQHLHRQNVGFRDHSLENVLMFRDKDTHNILPKITDPGQAVRFQRDVHGRPIELRAEKLFGKSFRPPEVYQPVQIYDPVKVDVFCMGWMLFFVVTKRQPFDRVQKDKEWACIERGEFEKVVKAKSGTRTLSPELVDLLKHMLDPNLKRRYEPAQCLSHPWFSYGDVPIDANTVHGLQRNRRR